jgi:hypothetical protein
MASLLPDGEEHEPLLDTPGPPLQAHPLRTPLWKRASPFWHVTFCPRLLVPLTRLP